MEPTVQAIRNINSGKTFILVEHRVDRKMRIINPEGQMIIVPDGLFENPMSVRESDFEATFTEEQISAIGKFMKKKGNVFTVRQRKSQARRKLTVH